MTTLNPPTVLVGTWRLERRIDDHLNDRRLDVTGELVIGMSDDALLTWEESGRLRGDDGHELPVWRRYLIQRRGDGWMVTFDDGRDFHPWSPGGEVVHPCAADTYRGHYDLAGLPDGWAFDWHVTGPAKDHRIRTTLQKPRAGR
ncbi:DUF6314 family protein [Aeromicrobium sp. CTD01-1L150]|uniref:DUF6314 family protein n=1 Tax=Aeromicrobium sp. CTD01-1L150 TaxID=3341830 RepID=UPI0035BED021